MNKVIKIAMVTAVLIFAASAIFLKNVVGKEKVVVVQENLTAGTVINENMLSEKDIPTLARVVGSYTTKDQITGKTLLVDRYKNDQIGSDMVGEKKLSIPQGEGIITANISKGEADNVRMSSNINIITYQINGETEEVSGFKVTRMVPGDSGVTGQEEYILTMMNSNQANEKVAPFIKSGNYKIVVVGD